MSEGDGVEQSELVIEHLHALHEAQSELRDANVHIRWGDERGPYTIDVIAYAALNRSAALADAFSFLVRRRNYTTASALVRLQLDSLMRFAGLWLTPNPFETAGKLIMGTPMRLIPDNRGKKLKDVRLQERLTPEYPWLEDVYKQASGFVHFSDEHVFAAQMCDDKGTVLDYQLGAVDSHVTDAEYRLAIRTFKSCVDAVVDRAQRWAAQKPGLDHDAHTQYLARNAAYQRVRPTRGA